SSIMAAKKINGTEMASRNICRDRTLCIGESAAKGPRPLAAPQIDTKIRIRREAVVAGGPKRSAAQRRNGSGRNRSAGVASRRESPQAKTSALTARRPPIMMRASARCRVDKRRNGERRQRIRRQPRAPHVPVAFLLPSDERYETGVEKRA